MAVRIGHEVIDEKVLAKAPVAKHAEWVWNALVAEIEATVAHINLIGRNWTGNVLEAA